MCTVSHQLPPHSHPALLIHPTVPHSLSMQEFELYFTSDITMEFLPGDHVLDTSITVANIARLTMHGGGNRATIVCSQSVGLSFTGMVAFKIHSLTFAFCSRNYGILPVKNYALLLQSTQYAELHL